MRNKIVILLSGPPKAEKQLDRLLSEKGLKIWNCRPKGFSSYEYAEKQIHKFEEDELIELMLIHVGRRTKLARELKDDFGLIHFGMGVNEGADIVCDPEMVIQKISILKGEN